MNVHRIGKTTAIRHIAVRETRVSWHNRGQIKDLPETPRTSKHYRIGEIKGGITWAIIMPRDENVFFFSV